MEMKQNDDMVNNDTKVIQKSNWETKIKIRL